MPLIWNSLDICSNPLDLKSNLCEKSDRWAKNMSVIQWVVDIFLAVAPSNSCWHYNLPSRFSNKLSISILPQFLKVCPFTFKISSLIFHPSILFYGKIHHTHTHTHTYTHTHTHNPSSVSEFIAGSLLKTQR